MYEIGSINFDCFTIDESNQVKISREIMRLQGYFYKIAIGTRLPSNRIHNGFEPNKVLEEMPWIKIFVYDLSSIKILSKLKCLILNYVIQTIACVIFDINFFKLNICLVAVYFWLFNNTYFVWLNALTMIIKHFPDKYFLVNPKIMLYYS